MLLFEGVRELAITLHVLWTPLLVPDANHGQFERRRMSNRRTLCAPLGRSRAFGEIDQVERVLDEGIKLVDRAKFARVELAGHSAVQNRQRQRANVFAQLEEFVKAEPERLKIV